MRRVRVPQSVTVPVTPADLLIHAAPVCAPALCVFHNPSPHHMDRWPIHVRLDKPGALAERTCPHGVGHPDPDSLAFVETLYSARDRGWVGVHGCCPQGCCVPGNA